MGYQELYVMSGNCEVAVIRDLNVTIIDAGLAPIYLKRTHNFEQWVADRAIDAIRPNSRVLKKMHGLSRLSSDYETAMLYNAACITDNYWVRKSDECWDDIKFNNDIYFRAAVMSDNEIYNSAPSRSPELTNIGSREKGWRLVDGKWWLYKNEPWQAAKFEYLTYCIGNMLGMDMAHYELDGDMIRSMDITGGTVNLQHIDGLVFDHDGISEEDLIYNYRTLESIDPALACSYADMKYLDALVNNVDRHTKNYGLLTSQEDGHIIKLAPNYDNDMAFYGYPDILVQPRARGEIREFMDLARETGYVPAVKLDRAALMDMMRGWSDAGAIADYLIAGEEMITK